jgi:hypothetical protein
MYYHSDGRLVEKILQDIQLAVLNEEMGLYEYDTRNNPLFSNGGLDPNSFSIELKKRFDLELNNFVCDNKVFRFSHSDMELIINKVSELDRNSGYFR